MLLLLTLLLLTGCATSRQSDSQRLRWPRNSHSASTDTPAPAADKPAANTSNNVVQEARKWLGSPYRYGGDTRAGVDCSGLVSQVYLAVHNLKLPRSSAQMQQYATPIEVNDLRPGDLLFFTYGSQVNHVGIYAGNNVMIHASSSKGVIESNITEPYYQRTFHSAGRVTHSK